MRWIVLALCVAALAGCADDASVEPPAMDHGGHAATHMMQNVTFFDDVIAVADSVSGTIDPQDHNTVQTAFGIAGLPTTNVKTHDVTAMIPAGLPAFVELEIRALPGIYAWLAADDFAAIWTSDCGTCGGSGVGTTWAGAVQNTGQTFTINVWDSNTAAPRSTTYEVTIAVSAAPDRLPSGVVVEVDMPSVGSHILFESVDGPVPNVMVFGPDDIYVATLPGGNTAEMYIEEGMQTGAYVFLPTGHGSFYKLRSGSNVAAGEALQVDARILSQIIQTGGPQPAGQGGTMTVEMPVQPLQTGLLLFGFISNGGTATTEGPEGFSIAIAAPTPATGFGVFTQTPMGHDLLRPGSYTITWDTPQNDGSVQVQEFFTLYGR